MAAGNRNLFRLTRFVLFKVSALFRFLAKFRKPQKRVLIIKNDAIGDYVLFRNFIEEVSKSEKFKDHQVDLLGNSLWQDLALKFDSPFVDKFFFVNPEKLTYLPLKTFQLGWQLYKRNYLFVLQPTYSRTLINDGLAGLAAAKQTVGCDGDTERISAKYKAKTDKFYNEKLVLPESVYFEFDRSRFFFETVLQRAVELNGPHIPVNAVVKKGIVVFPGAGVIKRGWGQEKFLALIKLIQQQSAQPIYLSGGPSEIAIGNYLAENLPSGSVTNLVNKTSLVELTELIGSASLIVSNETSAIHIAAATRTPAFCILGGGHFSRFAPYPEYMDSKPLCVYEKMDCYYCNWNCKFETAPNDPYPCISAINIDTVLQAVQPFL